MSCYFCQRNQKEIDFTYPVLLKKFLAVSGKIKPRKKTELCAQHQRKLALAVKRARFLGLLPFVKQ